MLQAVNCELSDMLCVIAIIDVEPDVWQAADL
jgi:hypothetical protein